MKKTGPTVALVLAGGRGTRVGSGAPKQYRQLAGKALLRWSLEILCQHRKIDYVKVVIHPDDEVLYHDVTADLQLLDPVYGGETRFESSRNGIQSFKGLCPKTILIHDGARPFLNAHLIDRLLLDVTSKTAVVPALKITDAVKRINNDLIEKTSNLTNLWRIQTPQAFEYDKIFTAYQLHSDLNFRDDSAVAEYAGIEVHVIKGSEENIKITAPEDFKNATRLIRGKASRVQVVAGFDVHKFGVGDHVMLCGVKIPFLFGLVGHSDADVALHALVDALLSGIDCGDIGEHFPSNEAKWRDRSSADFLAYTMELVRGRGAQINHIDLTVICNKPRISEYREVMRDKLSEISGISKKRISIKGTTTDGLGFTGRGEGIAVQATVTMRVDNE